MDFDFLFIGGYDYYPGFFEKIIPEIKKRGYIVGVISASYIDEMILPKKAIDYFNLERLSRNAEVNSQNYKQLSQIYCERYNILSMNEFVFTEHIFYHESQKNLTIRALKYFITIEEFFKHNSVKCFIQNLGSDVIRRVFRFFALKNNIPTITIGQSYFKDKLLLFTDEMNLDYDYTYTPYEKIPKNDIVEIKKYINKFIEEKKVFKYSFIKKDRLFDDLNKFILYLKNKQYYMICNAFRIRIKALKNNFERIISKSLYSNFDKNKKYIYYPLNAPADTEMSVRNPLFFHQEYLIEYISRCLPEGYLLYVKEHPNIDVSGELSYLQRKFFANKNNVRLLSPEINSHEIIKNAAAVIIVSSTVGFEAIHYLKPVVVLGNWSLRGKGPTIDVKDLNKLGEILKRAVSTKIKEEDVIAFLYSLKESSSEGSFFTENVDYTILADSLIKKATNMNIFQK